MLGLALLAIALTAPGQVGLPTLPDGDTGQTVELTADVLQYEHPTRRAVGRGHVVLRTGGWVVRADEMTYDAERGVAEARGHVLLVSEQLAGFAERITLDLETRALSAEKAAFVQKRGVAPETLASLDTAEALAGAGQNAFAFTASHFRILEDGTYVVEDISFTPCDCNVLEPSWRIGASSAEVRPGERARLTAPSVHVLGVPVLWLPWLSLPLTNRESGLLIPELSFSGLSGVQVDQPLFLTLGPSYDVTLTPGYAFGQEPSTPETGSFGVEGPRFTTEFRYAPSTRMRGRAWLRLLQDLKPEREPLHPGALLPDAGRRGMRGALVLEHQQELGAGFHQRADVTLYSDGYLFADTHPAGGLARSYYSVPSSATLYHRGESQYAGLALTYRQDLRWGYPLLGTGRAADGTPLSRPGVFQELPTLLYALPETPLAGPLAGSLRVELSRLSPLERLLGDEGTDGVFWPTLPDADGTQGNGRFDAGERQARTRLDIRPRLSAALDVGGVLRLTPSLSLRESLYFQEVTREARQRAYGMAGLHLDTELARVFGAGESAVRHSLAPSVELRAVSPSLGQPAGLYDEVDAAVPPEGLLQGLLMLQQKVSRRGGHEVARLDVAQGVDFGGRRLGETSGRILGNVGPVSAEATGRLDLFTPELEERLTQLAANVRWRVMPAVEVSALYDRTRGSSERVRRSIDALLPPPLPPVSPAPPPEGEGRCSEASLARRPLDRMVLAGQARFPFGLGLQYAAELHRRDPAGCDTLQGYSQTLGLSYSPSCDCWRMDVHASLLAVPPYFNYGVSVTLANFGTLGR